MVRGLVIRPESHHPIEVREFAGLDDYQQAVGGWIEAVDVPSLGISMFVNESGLIKDLPFNSRATCIWWYEVENVRHHAVLCGTAVVVGFPDEDGETQDLPQSTLALFTTEDPYAVIAKFPDDDRWMAHPREYAGYLDAVVWAMVMADPVTTTTEVRVVAFAELAEIYAQQDSGQTLDGLESV